MTTTTPDILSEGARICCNQKQRYIGFFKNEIPQVVCQKHYNEKELLIGAIHVIEIKPSGSVTA